MQVTRLSPTQEKVVIIFPGPYNPASAPDTELFVQALNDGFIDAFASRLAPTVAMASEDTKRVIRGRTQTLNYFAARLDAMNQGDLDDHLAVEGSLRALNTPDPDDDDTVPCAILYDGFQKICVLQLGIGSSRMVDRIMLSARDSTLRRAWPLEPPVFRDSAIMPQLAAAPEER